MLVSGADVCQETNEGGGTLTDGEMCTVQCATRDPTKLYYSPEIECDDGIPQDVGTGMPIKEAVCGEVAVAQVTVADYASANLATMQAVGVACMAPTEDVIVNIDPVAGCTQGMTIPPLRQCNIKCKAGYFPTVAILFCNTRTLQ